MGQARLGRRRERAQAAQPRLFSLRMLGLAFIALALSGPVAEAQTLASLPVSRPIENTGTARPVLAWTRFCERHADECRVNVSEPAVVTMTPQVWRNIVL